MSTRPYNWNRADGDRIEWRFATRDEATTVKEAIKAIPGKTRVEIRPALPLYRGHVCGDTAVFIYPWSTAVWQTIMSMLRGTGKGERRPGEMNLSGGAA